MEKIKIVAMVGSLRGGSFNRQLAVEAGRILGEGAEFEILDYADVPLLNQDEEFPAPPAVARIREAVKSADGIWFFTPEYNHFFPGVLKNLIDWLSRPISDSEPQVLAGKPTVISGISPGMSGTALAQDHLVTLLSFLNVKLMNTPRLTIPNAMQQLDQEYHLALAADSREFLRKQADAFLEFIRSN